MHSHHSHSGQYVQHATNTLEECVAEAISKGFKVFCLTEHMPRLDAGHLYPEEIESNTTIDGLMNVFDDYYHHAKQLQTKLRDQIHLLVGSEIEAIDSSYFDYVNKNLRAKYKLDMVVGSIHHVNAIPLDLDEKCWKNASLTLVKTKEDEKPERLAELMFEEYYDRQYDMLRSFNPHVVGHFDLIQLMALPENVGDFDRENIQANYPQIWSKIIRNIDYAVSVDSMIEINAAALRKGWATPYPKPEILKVLVAKKAKLCLSDDSHGIAQIGLNYKKSIDYLEEYGITQVYYLDIDEEGNTVQKLKLISDLKSEWIMYK